MSAYLQILKNPVIIKEIRTRMRGNRAFILLSAHLLLLTLVVALMYLFFRSSFNLSGTLGERNYFGKAIFGLIIWLELITVSFIAPALTSGSISLEKERQTYDLLRITLLPERSLIIGKYISGLIFIFLLLFTSIPVLSPAFIIGGVLPEEILISILILAVTAIAFCAAGIFLSSLLSRTLFATVLAYAFAIFMVFGIPMIIMIVLVLFSLASNGSGIQTPGYIRLLLVFAGWVLVSITPMGTIIATETIILDQHSAFLATIPLGNGSSVVLLSPWIPYVVVYLLLSIFLLWISVLLVRQVER